MTDSDGEVRFDPESKPGVSNLLSILGAATDRSPEDLADEYSQYGPLKSDTADAVVELLRPIQERFAALRDDPARHCGAAVARCRQGAIGGPGDRRPGQAPHRPAPPLLNPAIERF